MKISKAIVSLAAVGCVFVATAWAQGQQTRDGQMKAYIDMMRKDVRAERQSTVDRAMGLEAGDKAKFWAVYEKYQEEIKTLVDQRLANMKKYADNYENMTDTAADEIASRSMELDLQRAAIQKKYYGQMKSALGARVAARFWQVETMLDYLLALQIGSEIPLIP